MTAASVPHVAEPNGVVVTPPTRSSRHPSRRVLLGGLLVLLGLGAAVSLSRLAATPSDLTGSGTIEVEEVTLAAEAGGRVAELSVDEGSSVSSGQVVGRLSDPVLDVQVKQSVADAAQQQLAQAQLSKLTLRAPSGGIVQKRLVHAGEVVVPGTPILTVADPTDVKLTLYVPEADLGRVFVGQPVGLRADAFGDRQFDGRVSTIASRAEFTPRNIQTQHDRQNLVFALTVRVPNPDGALKAGLPVDATFAP